MRHAPLFALLLAAALVALALVFVPSCLGPCLETPPDWKAQRRTLRYTARDTVRRLEAKYGTLPVEEWPSEHHRQTYRNAKRILAELGDDGP